MLANQKNRWIRRIALVVVGASLSALLGASAFFKIGWRHHLSFTPRFPLETWLSGLPSHLPWMLGFALITALIIPLRALQWRFTLGKKAPDFVHRYHAVAIGAFFHNAVPGKLGELVRAFLLARRQKIPFFESLGSVLVCKILELAAIIAVVTVALLGRKSAFAPQLGRSIVAAMGLCLVLMALIVAVARWAGPWGKKLSEQGRWPRLSRSLINIGQGLRTARSVRGTTLAFLASFGPVLASTLAYGVALHALGVPRGIMVGGIILGAVSLGQVTPGLPVGTGMYYLLCSWAAREVGATAMQAAAFTALTHIAAMAAHLLVGMVSLLIHRAGWREILRIRSRIEAAAGSEQSH